MPLRDILSMIFLKGNPDLSIYKLLQRKKRSNGYNLIGFPKYLTKSLSKGS